MSSYCFIKRVSFHWFVEDVYILLIRTMFMHVCSVVSNSLWPHCLWPARILCSQDYPGKNTELGCHFLLQGIFSTQGSKPCLLQLLKWQADSILLSHLGSPKNYVHLLLNLLFYQHLLQFYNFLNSDFIIIYQT